MNMPKSICQLNGFLKAFASEFKQHYDSKAGNKKRYFVLKYFTIPDLFLFYIEIIVGDRTVIFI